MAQFALPTWQPRTTVPNATDIIETATFMDGLGRVIQVKKDASRYNTTTQQNERVREVSGMTTYDWQGMVTQETLSWIEQKLVTNPLGQLHLNPASILTDKYSTVAGSIPDKPALAAVYEYDLLNRVKTLYPATATSPANATNSSQGLYKISTHYAWDNTYDGETRFRQEVMDNDHGQPTRTQKYFNSKSAVVATKTMALASITSPNDIITHFKYDPLGQLTETTNPLGLKTTYSYDWFGRAWQEVHPDRGTTTSTFDRAGNVTQINTPNGSVSMQYHYNRLTQKGMSGSSMLDDVTYTYGTAGDGRNGAGRLIKVEQGSQIDNRVLTEHYTYDELGQVALQTKTIAIPLVGEMNLTTKYRYDSWGRLRHLTYPDLEEVAYTYAQAGGELESVKSIRNFGQTNVYDYVTQLGYDGYGNQQYMRYGNNVETVTEYSPYNRAMSVAKITTPHTANGQPDLLHKTITYKANGNIWKIENIAPSFSQGWNDLGGTYTNSYTYDFANRLVSSTHQFDGQQLTANTAVTYELEMSYNQAGGIKTKSQHEINGSVLANPLMDYNLIYNYQKQGNGKDEHKLTNINHSGTVESYTYDPRGNVTQIANHPQHGTQQFIWDEADRLMAVKNNQGLHHYVYDHTGTRILKGTYTEGTTHVNGAGNGIYTPAPYTVYTGPHMVCTFYADAVDVTKHYYAGAQRVASKLYQTPYGMDCPPEAPQDPENPEPAGYKTLPQPTSNYIWCQQPVQRENDIVVQGFKEYILPTFEGATVPQTPQLPAATPSELGSIAYQPCTPEYFTPGQVQDGQSMVAYYDCLCRYYPEEALAQGINCQTFTEIYWYHPDYLGNTEFITDAGGYPYQFFYYSAFGETLWQHDANTGSFNSPYRFNAKELDVETGNYYYGARYYNPQTSMWFGVDAMAHWYTSMNPYNFSANNPVMLVDPNGMWVEGAGFWNNVFKSDARNNAEMEAARHIGGEAYRVDGGWRATWIDYSTSDGKTNLATAGISEYRDNPGSLSGFADGFGAGVGSTLNFFKSLGTAQGWRDLGQGMVNFARMGSNNPFDIEAVMMRAQMSDQITNYVQNIPKMSAYEMGYDFGYGTEKFGEAILVSKGAGFGLNAARVGLGQAAFESSLIGGRSALFGRARLGSFGGNANGLLNRGYARIGWSYSKGTHYFQPRFGPKFGAKHYTPWFTYKP